MSKTRVIPTNLRLPEKAHQAIEKMHHATGKSKHSYYVLAIYEFIEREQVKKASRKHRDNVLGRMKT
jgi:hypothetical protein